MTEADVNILAADDELDGATVSLGGRDADLARVPALSAYLRQVEQLPQLSAEAQGELALAYQDAQRLAEQLDAGELDGDGHAAERRRAREADHMLETIVASNFRLVLAIAKEHVVAKYGASKGLELLPDMVSEGNMALVEAAKDFDPAKSPTFPMYAARSVRDRVRAALVKQATLRVPTSWTRLRSVAWARKSKLAVELNREPTMDELKDDLMGICMEWAEDKLTKKQQALPQSEKDDIKLAKLRRQGTLGAIQRLDEVLNAPTPQGIMSLDAPLTSENGSASRIDFVAEDGDDSMFDDVERSELREALRMALSSLTEREQRILLCRYGFVDGERWKYDDIRQEWGVSAERIRQIEQAALKKLQSPSAQWAHLGSFLPGQVDFDD